VFSAAEARNIGLVDVVASPGQLDDEVSRVVEMLMRGGPEALALTKQLVPKIKAMPVDEAFENLMQLSAERFASAEGLEGMQSFAQKRDPSWVRPV
jgi:methylglutaconyl-CoA hydratase